MYSLPIEIYPLGRNFSGPAFIGHWTCPAHSQASLDLLTIRLWEFFITQTPLCHWLLFTCILSWVNDTLGMLFSFQMESQWNQSTTQINVSIVFFATGGFLSVTVISSYPPSPSCPTHGQHYPLDNSINLVGPYLLDSAIQPMNNWDQMGSTTTLNSLNDDDNDNNNNNN